MNRILCVGDLDLDLFAGIPEIPRPDQKVSGRHLGQLPGGMAANVAVAVARLGGSARLLAAVGDDDAGRAAVAAVAAEGVDVGFVAQRENCLTFACVVLLSPSGEKALIRLETDAYLPRIADAVPDAFRDVTHVHSTYGDAELALHVLKASRSLGIATSLDLEAPDVRRAPETLGAALRLVDTLFVNREAWHSLSETLGHAGNPETFRFDGEIVLTLGAEGSRRFYQGTATKASGFPVAPLDTTGAGDCFAAAYLLCRSEGGDPEAALVFANAAAALSTLRYGAQGGLPAREAVERFLQHVSLPDAYRIDGKDA